jgi:hypothetical protein
MIRTIAKLCVVVAAVATFLQTTPSYAETPSYASNTGSGFSCTLTQPCTLDTAIANANIASGTGRVTCLNDIDLTQSIGSGLNVGNQTTEVFCPQGAMGNIVSTGANETLRVNGLTLLGNIGGEATLRFIGSGTLILENCALVDGSGVALDIEPNGPLNLVIKNCLISNNAAAGVLIKPAAGGSVTATFDGVTITKNAGGLKTDTTNGAVRVDISNSTISNNANNGLIAIGGAGGQNMVSVGNGVIASNSQAGIEASGAAAAVLVNNTLLDSNAGGAISAVSGGRILTYQNNRTIGSPGTGFTGTASPN